VAVMEMVKKLPLLAGNFNSRLEQKKYPFKMNILIRNTITRLSTQGWIQKFLKVGAEAKNMIQK